MFEFRFSPHLEDELPHELSTITEVDTPATSRLNATDLTNISETTLKNNSAKLASAGAEVQNLQYNAFPTFKDYIKSNPNISTAASVEDTIDLTIAGNTIPDDRLCKMLEPHGSRADELKYKPFTGANPENDDQMPGPSAPHLSYIKFPTHAEYAKGVSGLLDSQSIDQMQITGENDEDTNSSLPDIVSELKNRNILEHSFREAAGDGCDFDDLLLIQGRHGNSGQTTVSRKDDESLSDTLEHELNSMGLNWVTASLKKLKVRNNSTSTSTTTSDSSNCPKELHRSKQSPTKRNTHKRTFNNMNEGGDSFVDKNLVVVKTSSNDRSAARTQGSNSEGIGKQINLKEFMARELLKHSSVSSSSDSSLASMFLKSFLGQSTSNAPGTPTNNNNALDKHRTSTPIESKDGSTPKAGIRSSSSPMDGSKNDAASRTFFPNDSQQLSSVRFSSTSTSTNSEDRVK